MGNGKWENTGKQARPPECLIRPSRNSCTSHFPVSICHFECIKCRASKGQRAWAQCCMHRVPQLWRM